MDMCSVAPTGPTDDMGPSFVVGDTFLLGSNTVNSFRATYNSSQINKGYVPYFDAKSLGVRNIATPLPGFTAFSVSGGFSLGPTGAKPSEIGTKAFQLIDDFSVVRGAHQVGFGANFIRSTLASTSYGSAAGNFAFTGVNTGSTRDCSCRPITGLRMASPCRGTGPSRNAPPTSSRVVQDMSEDVMKRFPKI